MNTIDKLNNVLGYLTAMSFDRPDLSKDLVEPLNTLSEAISEVENSSLYSVVKSLPTDDEVYNKACDYARNVKYPLNSTNIKLRQAFANGADLIKNHLKNEK